MKKLNIIVIGLGHQSLEDHLPAIQESDYLNLLGVVDSDIEKAKNVAEEYSTTYSAEVGELLRKLPQIPDVALLALPHKNYLSIIKLLAEKQICIIKEKPFATSMTEAKEIIDIVKKNNISLQVTLQRRFNPIFVTYNQLLRRIGRIHAIEARYVMNIADLGNGWRAKKSIAGGGALIDLGYHYIDLIIWYFGLPQSIICRTSTKNRENQEYDVEDTAFVNFTYTNDSNECILGDLIVSRVYPEKEESMVAYGTKGSVLIQRGRVARRDLAGEEIEILERVGAWPSAIIDQLEEFSRIIINKKTLGKVDIQHLEHVAFIEAAYRSAEDKITADPKKYFNELYEYYKK